MGVATVAQRFAYAIVVLVDVVPSLPGNDTFLCTYTPRRKNHRKPYEIRRSLNPQTKKNPSTRNIKV
jgi:hypothetical protein